VCAGKATLSSMCPVKGCFLPFSFGGRDLQQLSLLRGGGAKGAPRGGSGSRALQGGPLSGAFRLSRSAAGTYSNSLAPWCWSLRVRRGGAKNRAPPCVQTSRLFFSFPVRGQGLTTTFAHLGSGGAGGVPMGAVDHVLFKASTLLGGLQHFPKVAGTYEQLLPHGSGA